MIKPVTFIAFARNACAALLFAAGACGPAEAARLPSVSSRFTIARIATVPGARELAFAPNGDLFVGTDGSGVFVVPHADGAAPGEPVVFAHFDDSPAAGVALGEDFVYVGTQFGVWRVPYRTGDRRARAAPENLAAVRTSRTPGVHATTSVAVAKGVLYASVGSSCNACRPEADATRATIGRISGGRYQIVARDIRNAIALTTNENTGSLWAGVAGEDDLPLGHPYEIFDDVTAHPLPASYGWPMCYEDQQPNAVSSWSGHDCRNAVVPRVVLPAYATPIGAVFYPQHAQGHYAFPQAYAGGAFITLHGSWHGPDQGLSRFVPPLVVFVPMRGDEPAKPVDWSDPTAQWFECMGGFQSGGSDTRIARPTGIAIGPQGDLFVADDLGGAIYRVRPIRARM